MYYILEKFVGDLNACGHRTVFSLSSPLWFL